MPSQLPLTFESLFARKFLPECMQIFIKALCNSDKVEKLKGKRAQELRIEVTRCG
jgi:hypothetical protein